MTNISSVVLLLGNAFMNYSNAFSVPNPCALCRVHSTVLRSAVDKHVDASPLGMDAGFQFQALGRLAPGFVENEKIDCDETVSFWRNFQSDGWHSTQQNLQNLARVAAQFTQTPERADYWLRNTGRSAYFAGNALLCNFGYRLYERLVERGDKGSPFDKVLANSAATSRILLEVALSYEQDCKRIEAGQYKKPYDMYQNTRQSSPFYFGRQTARFVQEAIGTLGRRSRATNEDKKVWISDNAASSIYPEYFQTAFHYQTDGWLSDRSAKVYETSTETLFLGRQDAMQRTALPPLVSFSKQVQGRPMKVLEVACGTGRFMTFARDNLPLNAEYTAVDLSPFYLQAVIDKDKNWRKVRGRMEKTEDLKPCRVVQAKAEDLPFEDDEYDAVVCVYLFHEIPREVRAQAAAEMARVVRPGGGVIFTDSTQLGDRPVFDESMRYFERMNEPFWVDYITDYLPEHFEKAGLNCLTKTLCASTKTLTFEKAQRRAEIVAV